MVTWLTRFRLSRTVATELAVTGGGAVGGRGRRGGGGRGGRRRRACGGHRPGHAARGAVPVVKSVRDAVIAESSRLTEGVVERGSGADHAGIPPLGDARHRGRAVETLIP